MTYEFERGVSRDNPAWEELFDLLDKKGFSVLDMLACVCACLCRYKDTEFNTELMCGGNVFNIKIEKNKKKSFNS